jgi:hypothetical protein
LGNGQPWWQGISIDANTNSNVNVNIDSNANTDINVNQGWSPWQGYAPPAKTDIRIAGFIRDIFEQTSHALFH